MRNCVCVCEHKRIETKDFPPTFIQARVQKGQKQCMTPMTEH